MIRKLLIAAVVVVVLLVGGVVALYLMFGRPAPTPPVFADAVSLDEAQQRATELDRPILVFATADWCIPCQILKRGALTDAEVARTIGEKTVPVYFDISDRENEVIREQARLLELGPIPVLIALRDGEEISRLEGMHSAEAIRNWLETL